MTPLAQSAVAEDAAYRLIFESTTDGLVVNDPETGVIVEVNPAFCAMHGYAYEELVGAHPSLFIHPDDLEQFGAFIRAFHEGRPFQTRARDVRKDGSVVEVDVRASAFLYRGRPHLLGVVRDVSVQEEAYRALEQRVDERTRMLELMIGVARQLAATVDPDEAARVVLEEARRGVDCDHACLYLLEDDRYALRRALGPEPRRAAIPVSAFPAIAGWIATGAPIVLPVAEQRVTDEATAVGLLPAGQKTILVPIAHGGRTMGFIAVSRDCVLAVPEPHKVAIMQGIADQAALAFATLRLHEQARLTAALEERHRIARDLHDSVSQTLFSTTMHARAAELAVDAAGIAPEHPLRRHVHDVSELTRGALAEMRSLIFELRPGALAEEGLGVALRKHAAALAARQQLPVLVQAPDDRLPLAPRAEEELYRLAQEALANVVKHAGASEAEIRVRLEGDDVVLEVCDDGAGFDGLARPGHLGLHTMRERAERAGGALELETGGCGTCVRVRVRMPREVEG